MGATIVITTCTKCGSSDTSVKHIAKGVHITSSAQYKSNNEFIRSSEYDFFWKWTAEKEHLLKTCNCCKNTWRTKCLDSI